MCGRPGRVLTVLVWERTRESIASTRTSPALTISRHDGRRQLSVQGLVRRARFADAAFTSAESFSHAVAETFDSARTQARIDAEVRRHGDVVGCRLQARTGDNPASTDVASKPAMEQYVRVGP